MGNLGGIFDIVTARDFKHVLTINDKISVLNVINFKNFH